MSIIILTFLYKISIVCLDEIVIINLCMKKEELYFYIILTFDPSYSFPNEYEKKSGFDILFSVTTAGFKF